MKTVSSDALDFRLLNDFQRDFPLCPAPYAEVAARLGVAESVVLRLLSQATNCTEDMFTCENDKVRKLMRHKADQDRAFNRSLRQLKDIQNSDLQRKAALYAHATKNPNADLSGYPGLANYHKFTKQTQSFPTNFENLTPEALQQAQKQAEMNRQQFRQYVDDFYSGLYTPKAA